MNNELIKIPFKNNKHSSLSNQKKLKKHTLNSRHLSVSRSVKKIIQVDR